MKNSLLAVTIDQMREVDRIMVDEIGVAILMMMENASRNIALLARTILGGSVKDKQIVILCGKGNNGGDGLGAARHLINYGAKIDCILAENSKLLSKDAMTQFRVLENIGANIIELQSSEKNSIQEKIKNSDLIIDALFGYNLKGDPKEPIATLINLANSAKSPILAVDIPSGLDGNTGQPHSPTVKADTTITLALPKVGLMTEKAMGYVGELYLADLSVPKSVYDRLGIDVPVIFEHQEIVRVQ